MLQACFPGAAVDRMDRDAAQRPGAQRRILRDWHAGDTDILVGTQMVSKGHDVPGVTLVVVLLADLSLNVPDFRAGERTFQLLVQVAGRAGRGDDGGPRAGADAAARASEPRRRRAPRLRGLHGGRARAPARRSAIRRSRAWCSLRIDGPDEAARRARRRRGWRERLRAQATALGRRRGRGARARHRRRSRACAAAIAASSCCARRTVPAVRALARAARAAERALRRAGMRLVVDVDPYST